MTKQIFSPKQDTSYPYSEIRFGEDRTVYCTAPAEINQPCNAPRYETCPRVPQESIVEQTRRRQATRAKALGVELEAITNPRETKNGRN